jgi:hypothetical protein
MGLNRYDAAATLATVAAGAVYLGHVQDFAFLEGPRVTAGLLLVTGLAACAVNGSRPGGVPTTGTYGRIASAFGIAAMVAGLVAITLGTEWAVLTTFAITVLMWAVTTTRNALTVATPPPAAKRTSDRPMAGVR